MNILYCTGNAGKFKEASFVFNAFNARGGAQVTVTQVLPPPDCMRIEHLCTLAASWASCGVRTVCSQCTCTHYMLAASS